MSSERLTTRITSSEASHPRRSLHQPAAPWLVHAPLARSAGWQRSGAAGTGKLPCGRATASREAAEAVHWESDEGRPGPSAGDSIPELPYSWLELSAQLQPANVCA